MKRFLLFFMLVLGIGGFACAQELRAIWVDGFHAGIRTAQEADQLVSDAVKANLNTIIVQVRRRGDSLYAKSIEPPVEDPAYDPSFDGLAYVTEAAHRAGIKVHAWINATPIWRGNQPPPKDPAHVFLQHGLSAQGEDFWLTCTPEGEAKFPVGYFLDPGHPAAREHLVNIYLNIVRNYDVDGIHFDYIRYPETDSKGARGAPVGYNPTSLERFRRQTGRSDTPAIDDAQWTTWRTKQITQLVRRIYIEAKAIKPGIVVSAATISWGKPPTGEKDFLDAAPGRRVYQDWHSWLKEGILDLAIPMNYNRESDPAIRSWFDGWIRWEKRHRHGRQLAVGIGAYLNNSEQNLAQIERVRRAERGNRVDGISLYSYASPQSIPKGTSGQPPADRLAYLTTGAGTRAAPYATPSKAPVMEWIARPDRGWIAGGITAPGGRPADGLPLGLRRAGWWPFRRTVRGESDGNGYFGFTTAKPGEYVVTAGAGGAARKARIVVQAGSVARLEFNLEKQAGDRNYP